jgi:hypothetical protein
MQMDMMKSPLTHFIRILQSDRVSDAVTRRTLEKLCASFVKLLPDGQDTDNTDATTPNTEGPAVDEVDALLQSDAEPEEAVQPAPKKRGK